MALIELQNARRRMMPRARTIGLLALFGLLAFPLVPGIPGYWVTLATYVGLNSIVGIGLVVLTGMAGITSFGQAMFVGIGAYATAILTVRYGLSPWVSLPLSAGAACSVAWLIGIITLRLSGHFLPLATIAWNISFFYLLGNTDFVSRYDGISGIPPLALFGHRLTNGVELYYLVAAAVGITVVATLNLLDSRVGRSIRGIRGGIAQAESAGINTANARLIAFVYAAGLASVSGWLYAHIQRAISPSPFNLNASIEYLLMVVVGGVGSIWGALLGAGVVGVMKEGLQDLLPKFHPDAGNLEIIVFGAILLVLLQTSLEGLWPLLSGIFTKDETTKIQERASNLALARRSKSFESDKALTVRSLRKEFDGLIAVNDLSFEVATNEIVGLIGPNGAGKTTTFSLVTGHLEPTSGSVQLLGQSSTKYHARDIAKLGVARTFQHVKLVPGMNVLDNVAIGAHLRGKAGVFGAIFRTANDEEDKISIEAVTQLERVGLADLRFKSADMLSLGQQRIVEIARALCLDPVVIFLDEPAAGLRYLEKEKLKELLLKLQSEGVTIVLVEHDMEFVMGVVDRLVVMNFGSKLAEGLPEAIRRNPDVVDAYLGSAT